MDDLPDHLRFFNVLPGHEVKTKYLELGPAAFEDWTWRRMGEVAKAARLIYHDSVQAPPTNGPSPSRANLVIVDNTLGYAKNLSILATNLRGLQLRLALRNSITPAAARDREEYQVTVSFAIISIITFFPREAINAVSPFPPWLSIMLTGNLANGTC